MASSDGGGGLATGVNIGNYKGVMLCNRPFAPIGGGGVKPQHSDIGKKAAFSAGVPSTELGLNPVRRDDVITAKREKKNTALSKHKKWLHDLQAEKERLEKEMLETEKDKEERRKRFEDKQAQMRKSYVDAGENNNKEEAKNSSEEPDPAEEGGKSRKGKRGGAKPMWAMTEGVASKASEVREEEEADELLEFVQDLDFDSYEEGLEARTVMDAIEKRMKALEKEVTKEEKELDAEEKLQYDSEGNPIPLAENKPMTLTDDNLRKLDKDGIQGQQDDDAMSVATTILSEAKGLRHVHSSKSVAVLAKKAQEKMSTVDEDVANPRIITIDEDKGIRITKKSDVNQLPYMHRNPAI